MTLPERFRGYLVSKQADGQLQGAVQQCVTAELPPGDVVVAVEWSSLNFKDGLSATGHPGVTRKFPHIPGIDAAGRVVESTAADVPVGTPVVITGFDQGQNTWGGFAELVRVPAEWVIPLPEGLSPRESMIYGTAGFTAAQCVEALEHHHVPPESGEVVVTGASGGVGSIAVAILARLGYQVVAVSGKPAARDLLQQLGASRILDRQAVLDESGKPLAKEQWAGAVDTVGGTTLASLVRSLMRHGCVAACGLVGGVDVPLTVYPFILRGVTLAGIDSVYASREERLRIWNKLAGAWRVPQLELLAREIGLEALPEEITRILAGEMQGRVIVRPSES